MKLEAFLKSPSFLIFAAFVVVIVLKPRIADAIDSSSSDFDRFDSVFQAAAVKYGIPNWLYLKAIAWNESSVGMAASVRNGIDNPADQDGSKSSDGLSWGVMQVTLKTAQSLRPGTTTVDLNNPSVSIDLGAKYFSQMLTRYSGDVSRAARAYNQGPGNEDARKPYADDYLSRFQSHYIQLSQMLA
jgi:membrane-bound lytic murein transglycosylase MltF